MNGASYFITLIDDFTYFNLVYLIFQKLEALDYFMKILIIMDNQLDRTVVVESIYPTNQAIMLRKMYSKTVDYL